MRNLLAGCGWLVALGAACTPAYIDVAAPKDAQFELVCAARCGPGGQDAGTLINVSFSGGARGFSLCCAERAGFVRQLETIRDVWCNGQEVPPATFGDLTVGTVVSEATGKRGATLDHGDGYAAFNCGEWLDDLIVGMGQSNCCEVAHTRSSAPPISAEPADSPPTSPDGDALEATQPDATQPDATQPDATPLQSSAPPTAEPASEPAEPEPAADAP